MVSEVGVTELERLTSEPAAWDDAVMASGGHMLQSWRWGQFKERFGWQTERVAIPARTGAALAQILFRQKFGVSVGYIPRGPVFPDHDPDTARSLWKEIDRLARKKRALTVIVEQNHGSPAPLNEVVPMHGGTPPIQPSRTVKIELGDDDALLSQMHQKTRYNVRLAQRRGVTSRRAAVTDASLTSFYQLLEDTSIRNEFGIHPRDYYGEFLQLFGPRAALLFAEIDGRPVAGVIAAAFGEEAIYMYGASSTKDRAHGAGFYIQFEAMRWAREQGCRQYDLWGIPAQDPHSTKLDNGDRIAGTTGSDWRGLYEFKTRFGGSIVDFPAPVERRYHPMLAMLAQRLYRSGVGI